MKQRAILLLSGGLDSIANLYAALKDTQIEIAMAITFHYGQKAAEREIQVAKYHCRHSGVPHRIIKTSLFSKNSYSALTSKQIQIPSGNTEVDIFDLDVSRKSANAVWVPNRNGLFLNIAAFFAESMNVEYVMIGFNQEEAQTFPDNSLEFMQAANQFFSFSTRNHVTVKSYTVHFNKSEIVKTYGTQFSLEKIWPCYQNFEQWCGQCESCKRYQAALHSCGLSWEDYVVKNKVFIRGV